MRRASSPVVLLLVVACGGSVAHTQPAKTPARQPASASEPGSTPQAAPSLTAQPQHQAASAQGATSAQPAPDAITRATLARPTPRQPHAAPAEPALPQHLDGGEIPRTTLLAVLSDGIGRFLQKVRAEPHLVAGRFVGWRLVSLFDGEPAIQGGVLQPGDTVMRVNGQSIERPEQFKNVWDSMATESELVLLVQRGGRRTEVRYRIVDVR